MPTAEKPRLRRRIWKWTRRVIVALFLAQALVVCAGLIYVWWANRTGEQRLSAALAEVRSGGLPLTREQIYKEVPGRDEKAGHLYLAALDLADATAGEFRDLPYVGSAQPPGLREPVAPAMAKRLREFADAGARYFALLDEAASRRARIGLLRFYEWGRPDISAPSRARQAANRRLAMSLLAQAEGKPDEALLACQNAIALSGMFDGQPLMLTAMTRGAIGAIVVREIEAALSRTTPGAQRLGDLKKALLAEDAALDLQEMVRGELASLAEVAADPALMDLIAAHRVYTAMLVQHSAERSRRDMKKVFDQMDAGEPDLDRLDRLGLGPSVTRSSLRAHLALYWSWHCFCPGATKAMHAVAMRRALADYDLAAQPLPLLASRARRLIQEGKGQDRTLNPRAVQLLLTCKAELRVAACAVDAEVHRIAHGRWPDKPPDAALLTDPFTGQPMKAKRLDDGWVIYSVGPNLADDGEKGYDDGEDDMSFRLFDVAARRKP